MTLIDGRPDEVRWDMGVAGDPHDLRIALTYEDTGDPVDVIGWAWRAWIATTPPTEFTCLPEDDGVTISLPGSSSRNLPGRAWRFDVTGRGPAAGEGITVVRGQLSVLSRVTDPL